MKNKIQKQNIIFLVFISLCLTEVLCLPILIEGQENNQNIQYTSDDLYDYVTKTIILRRKGIFSELGDIHRFYIKLKQDAEYIARIKITAQYGGTFLVRISEGITSTTNSAFFSAEITKQPLETKHTAGITTESNAYVEIIYTPNVLMERPEYTLYFNKTGFAGWWWIALSGIGALVIMIFIFSFMIIGLITVSRRNKTKRKKKKRK